MESPAANSHTSHHGKHDGIDLESSPGIIDFKARERRAELLTFACEIAAIGRSYRTIHHTLFGYSFRRFLSVLNPAISPDFASLGSLLAAAESEAMRMEKVLGQCGLERLPRRAKIAIAFRDALIKYTRATSDASGRLRGICQSMHRERQGQEGYIWYSTEDFKNEKASYDASVQEFRRWGERLTELTGKL